MGGNVGIDLCQYKKYLNAESGVVGELVNEIECDCMEEIFGINAFVLLASMGPEVVKIAAIFAFPGKLESGVVPGAVEDIKRVDKSQGPFILAEVGLVVKIEAIIGMVEFKSEVGLPILVDGLHSQLVDEVGDGAFALNAAVEVEFQIVLGKDSVIVVKFEAVILDAAVEGLGFTEGEPELELVGRADLAFLLVEGLLEGDSGGGGLACGFESEQFIVHEVVFEDRPFSLLQSSPRL